MHNIFGKSPVVTVNRNVLQSYLDEYHNPKSSGLCKADGQKWPCDTYRHLREALDA